MPVTAPQIGFGSDGFFDATTLSVESARDRRIVNWFRRIGTAALCTIFVGRCPIFFSVRLSKDETQRLIVCEMLDERQRSPMRLRL